MRIFMNGSMKREVKHNPASASVELGSPYRARYPGRSYRSDLLNGWI